MRPALDRLASILRSGDEHARLHAARTLQLLGEKARPALPAMRAALQRGGSDYVEYSLTPAVRAAVGTEIAAARFLRHSTVRCFHTNQL